MIRLTKQRHCIWYMDFFPDSSHFVTIGANRRMIWVWDLQNLQDIYKHRIRPQRFCRTVDKLEWTWVTQNHEIIYPLTSFAVRPQRRMHSLQFLDWQTKKLHSIPLADHHTRYGLAKNRTALVYRHGQQHWFSLDKPSEINLFTEYSTKARNFYYSDNLEWIAFRRGSYLSFFNQQDPSLSGDILFDRYVYDVAFSPSAEYVLVDLEGQSYQVYHTLTREPIGPRIDLVREEARPKFSLDEKYIFIGSQGVLHIIDWRLGITKSQLDFQIGEIQMIKFSDDGLTVALAGGDKQIVIFDLE